MSVQRICARLMFLVGGDLPLDWVLNCLLWHAAVPRLSALPLLVHALAACWDKNKVKWFDILSSLIDRASKRLCFHFWVAVIMTAAPLYDWNKKYTSIYLYARV